MKRFALALCGLCVLVASSCKTVPKDGGGAVTLPTQELQVMQTLTEFKVTLAASVQSPSAVTLDKAVFEFVVDGKVVHKGERALNLHVPANQATPFTLEESAAYVKSADELKELDARGGSLLAALRGRLMVAATDDQPAREIEFARSREVRVPRLPHVKFQEFEAGRYAEDEAGVLFHVGVVNPNPFQVNISSLTYKVELAGKQVAEGVVGKADRVDPSSTGVFDIEAKADASTHGAADVKKLIKGKVIPYVLSGAMKSDLFEEQFSFKGEIRLNTSK